ncbi:Odorant receptor 14 [Ephemera danica]|nr:Odorant receptor 14 [Ephemera danica]
MSPFSVYSFLKYIMRGCNLSSEIQHHFRFILVLNFVFGHWFHVSPLKLRGVAYICAAIFITLVNLAVIVRATFNVHNLIHALPHFAPSLLISLGVIGAVQSVFRTTVVLLKRKEIENIFLKLKVVVDGHIFPDIQTKTIKTALKYSYISVSIYIIGFITAMIFHSFSWQMQDDFIGRNENTTTIKSIIKHNALISKSGYWEQLTYTILYYTVFLISVGKIAATDLLFFSWYSLLIAEMDLLVKGINQLLCQPKSNTMHCNLSTWLQFHQEIVRLMQRVSTVASPCAVLTIAVNTLHMCFLAYIVTKRYVDTLSMTVFMAFALLALLQSFFYCNIGQKIRNKVAELQQAAYAAPWLDSPRDTQHAMVMICSSATERAMPLPGAPFFALSLEFFASVLGAVFTYFIVLLQIN